MWTLVLRGNMLCSVQALLDEWRAELARKPLSMSEGEACKVLGLEPRPDGGPVSEDELKAAYRRWAACAACPAGLRSHRAT